MMLALCLNGGAFAMSASDFGLTPFAVLGPHYSFGLETNRWWVLADPGWSPENNGNTLMSRMIFAGYGFRLYYDYSEDEDQKTHHGVYFSPMVSFNFIVFGFSFSADVGMYGSELDYGGSGRFWVTFVGADFSYTAKKRLTVGVYLYIPIYFPAAYYV